MDNKDKTNIIDFQKQKARLLHRNKNTKRLSIEQFIIRFTNDQLIFAEMEVRDENVQTTISESEVERDVFFARVNIIKDLYKQNTVKSDFISKNWKKEALYLARNKFPYSWMLTPTIQKSIDKHKPLIPLLNYLHTMGKEATRDMKKEMNVLTGAKKFNGHAISCFIGNSEFRNNVMDTLKIPERTLRKYIWTMFNVGILKFVKMYKGNVRIYSFGYYTQWDGRDQHRSYVKETTEYKKALREFTLMA